MDAVVPTRMAERSTRSSLSHDNYNFLHNYVNEDDLDDLYESYDESTNSFPVNYQFIKLLLLIYNYNNYCGESLKYYKDKFNSLLVEMCDDCNKDLKLNNSIKAMCLKFFEIFEGLPPGSEDTNIVLEKIKI